MNKETLQIITDSISKELGLDLKIKTPLDEIREYMETISFSICSKNESILFLEGLVNLKMNKKRINLILFTFINNLRVKPVDGDYLFCQAEYNNSSVTWTSTNWVFDEFGEHDDICSPDSLI